MKVAEWKIARACLLKESRLFLSYRFTVLLNLVAIFFAVANYYLLGETVMFKNLPSGHGYFEFVMIGIAVSTFLLTCMSSLMQQLAQEMQLGTVEMLLRSPVPAWRLLIYNALWPILQAAILVVAYLVVAVVFFSVNIPLAALPGVLSIIILSLPPFLGIGLLAAAVTLIVKRATPLQWLLNSSMLFLGGVYFPTQVMPTWLQKIASLLPMQYVVGAVRDLLLPGTESIATAGAYGKLLLLGCIWLSLGMIGWQLAWHYVRRFGTLLAH